MWAVQKTLSKGRKTQERKIHSTYFVETRQDPIYEYRRMRSKEPTTLFGRRLRAARLLAGIPQDKLGVLIGLDETTASARISRYETGENSPPFDIASNLANVLGIPTAYLYCEDDELADVILAWPTLSKSEKRRVKVLVYARTTG